MAEAETYIEHVTTEGERWDQIALEYYGSPARYEPIISANPGIPISGVLESAVTLRVPLLPDLDPATIDHGLPPWKV